MHLFLRYLLVVLCVLWASAACRPVVPPKPGAGAGSRLNQQLRGRACPHVLALSPGEPLLSKFQGSPCALSKKRDDCVQAYCVPSGSAFGPAAAPDGFFSSCDNPTVLCVGPSYATKTLSDAATQVAASAKITRVLLAPGRYKGGVEFAKIKRTLTIEGASNDIDSGVIIEGPVWDKGALPGEAAALWFHDVTGLVLRRLVVTGGLHGIVIQKVQTVGLDSIVAHHNVGHGVRVEDTEKLDISRSQISYNGMPTSGVPTNVSPCRYGLALIGVRDVLVATSQLRSNGAGGLRSSPKAWPAPTGVCEAVRADAAAQATVLPAHSLALTDNLFERNGPAGWHQDAGKRDCKAEACAEGQFCERGRCLPLLQVPADAKAGALVSVVGVGVAIEGGGFVMMRGNSLEANDVSGLLAHSIVRIEMLQNAISHNGLRRASSDEDATRFAAPALHLWHVLEAVTASYNLIVDNVATGLHISSVAARERREQLEIVKNHISGNGRFVEQRNAKGIDGSDGSGVVIDVVRETTSLALTLNENYFTANARAGIWLKGALSGDVNGNYLEFHFGMGIVLRAIGAAQSGGILSLQRNTIKGAWGCGILANQGATRLLFDANLIKDIKQPKDAAKDAPADAIQLVDRSGDPSVVTGNLISEVARVGLLLHKSQASLKQNGIVGSLHGIATQSGGGVVGEPVSPVTPLSAPLPLSEVE